MTPAEVVIKHLGVRPLARELGLHPSAVSHWQRSGTVPAKYHQQIIELSDGKVDPIDLVYGREDDE